VNAVAARSEMTLSKIACQLTKHMHLKKHLINETLNEFQLSHDGNKCHKKDKKDQNQIVFAKTLALD